MNIAFIGNCQTASLCFYFQQLLGEDNIYWLLYGDDFKRCLGNIWDSKIKNKILNYDIAFDIIKNSDVIIYQEINKNKSKFSNTETLQKNKKSSCRLIRIPSIYLNYLEYNNSIKELKNREATVDITVSDIFEKHRDKCLMLSINHPNTFLFLEVIDKICILLNIDTFSQIKKDIFLQDNNYMELP
jgi:hypothetical protein